VEFRFGLFPNANSFQNQKGSFVQLETLFANLPGVSILSLSFRKLGRWFNRCLKSPWKDNLIMFALIWRQVRLFQARFTHLEPRNFYFYFFDFFGACQKLSSQQFLL
jgi:hypothetical protein